MCRLGYQIQQSSMKQVQRYRWTATLVCVLFICMFLNGWIYWQHARVIFSPSSSLILIHSGVRFNSFNPRQIHLSLNSSFLSSHTLTLIDNQIQLPVRPVHSSVTMFLSDGYHHLQVLLLNHQSQTIDYYQEVDLSTGERSLIVTALDEGDQPVTNLSVHLELVEYTHITSDLVTNEQGEVRFEHLPEHTQVYIEAVCPKRKRHAFVEINTNHYRNITLVLRDTSSMHYDEYDSQDRGYYAV